MIGGQALIEGIYMRGPEKQAIVVRSKDGLVTKVDPVKTNKDRNPIFGWPLIRGVVNFGASMVNGVKALMFSANYFPDDEQTEPTKLDKWMEKHIPSEKLEQAAVYVAVLLGAAFSVGLFFLLPTFLIGLIPGVREVIWLRNLLEGVLKIGIFLAYLIGISKMKDMKRIFSYHGAEHKTIRCYEAGLPLTVENVRPMTRLHPRCGTSFLFVVIILAILCYSVLFSIFTPPNTLVRILLQLLLIPVVVGIAYEINHYVGRHDNAVTKIITAPGLWLQNFTTFEPDDSMIEVGIESLKQVIPEQKGKDTW